ncbi:MAG: thioredoxin family protein [Candidatus Obscuribacterales bacterium]|nr:thioredoxin family protein [Candidatus Obscuribacterales bacterium]
MKIEYIAGAGIAAVLLVGAGVYFLRSSEGSGMKRGETMTQSGTDNMPSKEELQTEAMKARKYPKAPELGHYDAVLNTNDQPISITQFKGKNVVLIDFWTYSCINCQRTLPYVTTWYGKYKDQGLVVIGIHTPEFSFEKNKANVAEALKRYGIEYPVILDNDFATWNNFSNQYWPRKYLIDIDGYVVYDHAGEGNYEETEIAIQRALKERAIRLSASTTVPEDIVHPSGVMEVTSSMVGSPETYFGSARNESLSNGNRMVSGAQMLQVPETQMLNRLYLGGNWNFTSEYAEGSEGADVVFKYSAKSVYFVASSKEGADVEITIDGKAPENLAGADVQNGMMKVKGEGLYKVIEASGYGTHILKMHIKKGKVNAFTFTFG